MRTGRARGFTTDWRTNMRELTAAQKPAKGAPAYSRFVNRRLGRIAAAAAHMWSLTPNQVTAISALFTFVGILMLAGLRPTPPVAVAVTVALVVGYALDSADGQLARLRGGGSLSGEWLDHVIDAFKLAFLHVAVLISLYRFGDFTSPWPLLIPLAFGATVNVWFFTIILTDQLRRQAALAGHYRLPTGTERSSTWRSILALPTDYGILCLIFILLPWPVPFLTVYTLLGLGTLLFLAAALPHWHGEIRNVDLSVQRQTEGPVSDTATDTMSGGTP